jgi:peptide/nickel transport system substrate-binding protein
MTGKITRDSAPMLPDRLVNRRRLMQGAAAAGLSAAAFSGVAMPRAYFASAQDAEDGLLTISNEQQQTWVRAFNPLLPENTGGRWPTQYGIYEPMMIYNIIAGELVPWLATEYAFNEDNSQLTFKTREGVNWSDGTPFTARDVAFTFNLLKDTPGLTSPSGVTAAFGEAGYLESVEATDDTTVVFTFSRVYTPGLYDVAEQPIVPEHIWSAIEDPVTFANEEPVATGPFTEITRFETQIWTLEKNPNYWQEGLPKIQGFRLPAYASNDQANLATINGENDWAGNFIPDIEKTYVAADPEHNHYWFPSVGAVVHLYAQTSKAPWDNADVRKAVSMAINREQIVDIAMFGYTHPADGTGMSDAFETWKDQAALDAGAEWVTYNPDKANELLDAAGFARDGDVRKLPDGTPMEYEINVVTGWSDWVSACEIMAQSLAEVGIKASVQPYDFSAWQEKVQLGDFDLSIGWSSQGATPLNFYRGVMGSAVARPVGEIGTENWQRYTSTAADDLLDQFAATSDPEEQKQIVNEMQMAYATEAPAIPLFPGPAWGQYNDSRFTGFPNEEDPYAILSNYEPGERLLVMVRLEPVASA